MREPCPHCEDLREEIAYLRAELALDAAADKIARLKSAFDMPAQQGRIVLLMLARKRPLNNALFDELLPTSLGDDGRNSKLLPVHICRLRKALGPGCIETVYGHGYRLTDAGRAKVEGALA